MCGKRWINSAVTTWKFMVTINILEALFVKLVRVNIPYACGHRFLNVALPVLSSLYCYIGFCKICKCNLRNKSWIQCHNHNSTKSQFKCQNIPCSGGVKYKICLSVHPRWTAFLILCKKRIFNNQSTAYKMSESPFEVYKWWEDSKFFRRSTYCGESLSEHVIPHTPRHGLVVPTWKYDLIWSIKIMLDWFVVLGSLYTDWGLNPYLFS